MTVYLTSHFGIKGIQRVAMAGKGEGKGGHRFPLLAGQDVAPAETVFAKVDLSSHGIGGKVQDDEHRRLAFCFPQEDVQTAVVRRCQHSPSTAAQRAGYVRRACKSWRRPRR